MMHLGDSLSAYLDGELSPEEHNSFTSHLHACGQCRSDLDGLHEVRAAIRSLPTIEAPAWMFPMPPPARVSPARRRTRIAALAAVTVFVVAIGISALTASTPGLELNFNDIAHSYSVRASQDGPPTGARVVQIAPSSPGAFE